MKANFSCCAVPALLTLLGLCLAPVARAFTSVGDMIVLAGIDTACSISASPMAFGIVVRGVVKETEAVVTAVCTPGTTYTLDLGDGLNHTDSGGTDTPYRRQMVSGANLLRYKVFQEPARATEIAASAAGTLAYNNLLTSTVGNGADQTKTIYGRVVGVESADAFPGTYTDTVVVTIAF